MRNIIFIIATVLSVVYGACTVGAIMLLANGFIDIYGFLYYMFSAIVSLLLLWGLSGALARVEKLENI